MRICVLLLCLNSAALAAAPRVVASIAPVYEITAEIMTAVAEPGLIIDNHVSAHHFAFKPSDMHLLQQADLVIWIDRNFEAGFSRVPEILPAATRQLELMPALGLEGGDGHIWYSPRLLLRSIEIISNALVLLDPEHQKQYQANMVKLTDEVVAWRHDTRQHWQNRQPRFVTDHNFSGHLEQDIGISAIATVHNQHHDHGGLKGLNQLDSTLRQSPAACLLTLQTTTSPLARRLAQKHGLKIISIALEPINDPAQPAILQRLTQFTTALERCF